MINKKIKKGLARGRSMAEGFTLVETLFAVLILSVAIVGPLTIAARGLNAALIAKDQATAAYLAQDAMEYVRFARDTNKLAAHDWLAGPGGLSATTLTPCVSANGTATCYFDSTGRTPGAILSCGSGCGVINYDSDPTKNFYTYASVGGTVTATPFTRVVQIISPIDGNQQQVIASTSVSWKDVGGVQRSVVVRENLFDWQ